MRVMMFLRATPNTEAGVMPTREQITGMSALMEEMAQAGILLAGEGLKPSSNGKRISFANGKVTSVTDGPFAETKELVAGYALIQVDSLEQALEWAERFAAVEGTGETELRPLYEASDFPDDLFPPEEQAREQALRDELQAKYLQQA